ncbi:MAG: dihydroneopterin aldolase [Bacteroidales bacterium]|nr:dihydroneopterin aldolase [Bacteroidales bacterium]
MSKISIKNMEFYAFHGCFEQERKIGTHFSVDISFDCDSTLAEQTDRVEDTVDYSKVYLTVKEEMEKPSHLLEHVARRIINRVKECFPSVRDIQVEVKKLNPPVGGKMDCVSVELRG